MAKNPPLVRRVQELETALTEAYKILQYHHLILENWSQHFIKIYGQPSVPAPNLAKQPVDPILSPAVKQSVDLGLSQAAKGLLNPVPEAELNDE